MSAIEVLFPKARAEILRLLFADASRELHLRELARLSHLTVGTMQQEVAKLTAAGLLTAERDGNRLYYRANTIHPIYPDLRQIALKTTGLREQLAAALEDLPGIKLAFVFGSQASGGEKADSDIDLLVIGNAGLRSLAPRLRPLTERLGREINPYAISTSNFAAKARQGDAFISNVLAAPKLWIIGKDDELGSLG